MKVYTKGGDHGTTSLVGGERVSKDDARVEAYGTVDELMAQIALLHDNLLPYESMAEVRDELEQILNTLMSVAAILATDSDPKHKVCRIEADRIAEIESWIDQISAKLPPITRFTLPGGHVLVSLTHICRTICRRAERRIVHMSKQSPVDEHVSSYVNRLSDYLYVLGRKLTLEFNVKETYWVVEK